MKRTKTLIGIPKPPAPKPPLDPWVFARSDGGLRL